jgi:hypothetical protein
MARVTATGQVTSAGMVAGASATSILSWPRLAPAGAGFVLAWLDQSNTTDFRMHGARVSAGGTPNDDDLAGGAPQLSDQPTAHPFFRMIASTEIFPEVVGPQLASGRDGQIIYAYAAEQKPGVARVRTRTLQGKERGDRCDPARDGLGCGDGHCERDPETASAGLCCDQPCSGPCQKCTAAGCVGVPSAGDAACGMISCEALSTECRAYRSAPMQCSGFNRCGITADLSTCRAWDARNEGGRCSAPGCTQMGSCQKGDCVCADSPAGPGGPRALPPGCQSAGPSRSGAAAGLLPLALLLLLVARRRLALALVALLGACNDPTVLQIDLALDDATLSQTQKVRVVIRTQEQPGFSKSPAGAPRADELVRNLDIDADGSVEIVADLLGDFPYGRGTTYLKVVPSGGPARNVVVGAQAVGFAGNPVAQVSDKPGVLPGATIALEMTCTAPCAGTTMTTLDNPITVDPTAHPVTALAAGGGLLAVGVSGAGPAGTAPNRGLVALFGPDETSAKLKPLATITGERSGDLLGAALGFGDLNGDGNVDLVMGAPGARNQQGQTTGAVHVWFGPLGGLSGTLQIGMAGQPALSIAAAYKEELGASLVVHDVDGDGRPEIVAGAPAGEPAPGDPDISAGAVYLIRNAAPNAKINLSEDGWIVPKDATGAAISGAHLGRSLAANAGYIAAGAPGANRVYLIDPKNDFTQNGISPPRVWHSEAAGAIGSAVALVDVAGNGTPMLAAAAPGGESVYLLEPPSQPVAFTDADVKHVVSGTAPGVSVGATLSRIPTLFGDLLAVGTQPCKADAQVTCPAGTPTGGAALLVAPASIAAAGSRLPLAFDGSRAMLTARLESARVTVSTGAQLLSSPDTPGLELVFGDDSGRIYVKSQGGAK